MSVVFVLTLIQDLNVVAPIARMAPQADLLVATRLSEDPRAPKALHALSAERRVDGFADVGSALSALSDRAGLLVFPSESRHPDHRPSHVLARACPSRFLTATLQHGLSCVGFNDPDHPPRNAGFASDLVCSWFGHSRLTHMAPADQPRVYVTGPPMFCEPPGWRTLAQQTREQRYAGPVLVCENLHGAHMRGATAQFITVLEQVARSHRITLRPHPSGIFAKGKVHLPHDVTLDDRPLAEAELQQYALAITTPSTMILDLIRAEVPVAVWRDSARRMACDLYRPLTMITEPAEWMALVEKPPPLHRQRTFLGNLGFPDDIAARFRSLFAFADDVSAWSRADR